MTIRHAWLPILLTALALTGCGSGGEGGVNAEMAAAGTQDAPPAGPTPEALAKMPPEARAQLEAQMKSAKTSQEASRRMMLNKGANGG